MTMRGEGASGGRGGLKRWNSEKERSRAARDATESTGELLRY
jgi:hypothetical protein